MSIPKRILKASLSVAIGVVTFVEGLFELADEYGWVNERDRKWTPR